MKGWREKTGDATWPPMGAETLEGIRTLVDSLREVSVSLDLEETLEAVLDGVQTLFPFDAAAIYVVHPDTRELIASAERGYPASSTAASSRKARQVLKRVFERGRVLTADVSSEPAYVARRRSTKAEVAVPILASRRRIIGALIVESDVRGSYAVGTSDLLELYASGIAGAIERTVLHGKILRARRLEQELELARRVMKGLLPRRVPRIPGVDLAARLKPQLDVGGDYYDFVPIDDDRWGVVIADVVGKGVGAALLMSTLRASLHSMARSELALRSLFKRANRFFRASAEEGKYATAFLAELDYVNRRLMYINAGHPPPILLRREGSAESLNVGGCPVGLFADTRYVEGVVELEAGDVLALYTDGITDTTNRDDEPYGEERLVETLIRAAPSDARHLNDELFSDLERFQGTPEPNDDRTLVILRTT